jgi:hypothetical protein
MENVNHLSIETINKLGLVDNIINLYANIPDRNSANNMIHTFLKGMNVSDQNILDINNKLDDIGVSKLNKDGLNQFIAKKLVTNYNVSESMSFEIVSLSNKILSSYLERTMRDNETIALRKHNESHEAYIDQELEKLKKALNERLEIKYEKLKIFEKELNIESELTVTKFVEASNLWLDNPITENQKNKIKNDVNDFLNGDNNIIIEL